MSDHDPTYWPKLVTLLSRKPVRQIIDGGANHGEMSAHFAEQFPDARILAVEASPPTFASLSRRFTGAERIDCVQCALGERAGETEFHVNRFSGTSSVYPRVAGARRYFSSEDALLERVTVPLTTLDELCASRGIEHVDLLKLDTQGYEFQILSGARGLLAGERIDVIYTEFFIVPHYEGAPLLPQIWQLLEGFGYTLYDLFKGPCGVNGQLRFGDAIFVSPAFRRGVLDQFPEEP